MREEGEYWSNIIAELRRGDDKMTLAEIAEACGVQIRQVSNWIKGDRPLGRTAVKLYELHARRKSLS